jgi:hypothetical protein
MDQGMTSFKLRLGTFCIACAMPLAALADPPQGSKGRPNEGRPGGGERFRGPADWNAAKEHDYEQFMAFSEVHAHNRWKELKKREGENNGHMLRSNGLLVKFRMLQMLEKQDKDLYTIKVKQIETEDVEYGLVTTLREKEKAPNPNAAQIAALKADLKNNAKQFVMLRLEERGKQIDRIMAKLEQEKKNLSEDQTVAAQSRLTDERYNQMLAEGPDFFNFKPIKHDGEGGAGGGPSPGGPSTTNASQSPP